MPLLLIFIGLLLPRLTAILLLLFSGWFASLENIIIPILGIVFVPYTLLWYTVVLNWFGGTWGLWQLLFLVIALMLDLSSYSSVRRH